MTTAQRVYWFFRKYKLDTQQISRVMKMTEGKAYEMLDDREYGKRKAA